MENEAAAAGAAFGRGMAAIITTTFGFVWLGWGFSVVPGLPVVVWVAQVAVAVVLLVFAILAVRRGRKRMGAHPESRDEFWRQRRKSYGIVVVLEFVGCILVVVLVNIFQRPDWLPVGISLVVGVHFLPLGRIFGFASYYWVGTLIVVADILALTAFKSWRLTASSCIATGVILWVTAVYLLIWSFPAAAAERSV